MTKGPIVVKISIKVGDKKHPVVYQHKVAEAVFEQMGADTVKEKLVKAFSDKLDEAFKGTPPKLLIVRNKDV